MAKWNTVIAESNCGYKHTQYVLESRVASAKVWSQYDGEVEYNFDTDDSPSITGRVYIAGLTKEQVAEFGKKIITEVLLPKYVKKAHKPSKKVVSPSKKVARKFSTKKVAKKASPKQSGNSSKSLSVRASLQRRDSRGRFV